MSNCPNRSLAYFFHAKRQVILGCTKGGTQSKKDGTDTLRFVGFILMHVYEFMKMGISESSKQCNKIKI